MNPEGCDQDDVACSGLLPCECAWDLHRCCHLAVGRSPPADLILPRAAPELPELRSATVAISVAPGALILHRQYPGRPGQGLPHLTTFLLPS